MACLKSQVTSGTPPLKTHTVLLPVVWCLHSYFQYIDEWFSSTQRQGHADGCRPLQSLHGQISLEVLAATRLRGPQRACSDACAGRRPDSHPPFNITHPTESTWCTVLCSHIVCDNVLFQQSKDLNVARRLAVSLEVCRRERLSWSWLYFLV